MIKKITGIIMSVFMILSCVAPVYSENAANENDFAYENRIEKLTYLGITFDEGITKDTPVPRSSFIRTFLKFVNIEPINNDLLFYDVDKDHPCFTEISTGAANGYMVGFSDGKFYPDKTITVNEAIKTFVNALGYELPAENRGGYPNGYIMTAHSIGLLENINTGVNELNYEDYTKFLENALECNIYEISYDGQSVRYEESDKVNALQKFRDIIKVRTTVTANAVTGLESVSDKTSNSDYVKLNGEEVLTGETNIADYIGYAVEAYIYYEDEDAVGEVKFFNIDRKNNTIIVDAEYIYDDSSDFSAYNFVYETESGRTKNIKITSDTSIIYNGAAKPEYSKDDLIPEIGNVTLIDSNNDGTVDCISIFKAEMEIIVDYASSKDDGISISDKKDSDKYYLYDNEYENYVVYVDGEKSSPGAISAGMLVLIGTNGEHSITYAYSQTITGTISEITNDNNGSAYVTIDKVKYKIAPGSEKYSFRLKDTGVFWIDDKNNVYGFEKDLVSDKSYGYLIRGYLDEEEYPIIAGIKVLTANNDIERYDFNEYIKLNNRKTENIDAANALKEEGEWKDQLVMYKLDENKKVTELYTVTDDGDLQYGGKFFNYTLAEFKNRHGAEYGDNVTEFSYVNKAKNEYLANNGEYNYYGSSWRNLFWQDDNTIWFNIYDDDLETSYVGGKFREEKHSNYELEFYNILEEKNTADVIIYRRNGAASADKQNYSTSYQCTPTVVTKVGEMLNEDDETVLTVTANNQGKTVFLEYYDKMPELAKAEFNSIKPGDIIYYELDTLGRITFLYRVLDIDRFEELGCSGSTGLVHGDSGLYPTSRESLYVTVKRKLANNFFEFTSYGDKSGHIKKILDGTTCYRMTVSGKKVTVENISWDDVRNGDNILVYSRYAQSKSVIVVDKK